MLQKLYVYIIFFPCIVVHGVDSPSVGLAVHDSEIKVSTLGGSVGHCEKNVNMNTCLILHG